MIIGVTNFTGQTFQSKVLSHPAFTCSKSTKTLEQGVKCVQQNNTTGIALV